jgi:amino acid adenylation domain-containing protein
MQDQLVHDRFQSRVLSSPDAIAVCCGTQHLTYAELNRRANQIAHALLDIGIMPDDRVVLCVERTVQMVIGLLGILKSGAAYVPVDPNYPVERQILMMEDSSPAALVTWGPIPGHLQASHLPIVLIDSQSHLSAENPSVSGLTARNLAYMIYTSGSTGVPKGVMIEHANILRLFSATSDWFGFTDRDVWTLFHSISFDFSVWEVWGALLHGGRLIVVPTALARSPDAFYRLLCDEGVTVLNQTPSAFVQLIAAQQDMYRLRHSLRLVIFGGEVLELYTLRPWTARHGVQHPMLINMYGITETTVHVTYREIGAIDVESELSSVVGRPIPDLQIHILDEELRPVAVGVAGEIHVGGAGLARGYFNRPTLTAERFIRNPYSDRPGERLYKTGDIGKLRADGDIEYLGRADQQVKIRGFRIEPGEIEAHLVDHVLVKQAAVIPREDLPGDRRLVAYVVADIEELQARSSSEVELIRQLRSRLEERLPQFMLPSAIVPLKRLPLTANGKLDRKALPVPGPDLQASPTFEAPTGEIECQLAAIWREILQVDRVGRDDNFFAAGGHSLLGTRFSAMATKRFGVAISAGAIHENPSVCLMARFVESRLVSSVGSLPGVAQVEVEEGFI